MELDTEIIAAVAAGLLTVTTLPVYLRHRRRERATEQAESLAHRYGLDEPASLHPVVQAGACIGTGNCLAVCPEENVLGFKDGQAVPISPARCIGHGLCERACPVDAIQLVFGTEKRGVDIPHVQANFETNVPGLYIIGELGGMGLIRNAFEQGRQCVDGIAKSRNGRRDALDVVIVGCGPAGLSASLNCIQRKLRFKTLEKEQDVGGTVRYYPRKKLVMTSPVKVPGYGKIAAREILKEDLIGVWEDVVDKTGLEINVGEAVEQITRTDDGYFIVTSARASYKAKHVVLAIGRRGVPRKLNVPGERLPKVVYSLREPEVFRGDRVIVVGGGDSAVEAALALADQPGTEVTLSYRKDRFSRIKPANLERVMRAAAERAIEVLWSTNLVEITPTEVLYKEGNGSLGKLANDLVAIFVGGELPTSFLQKCGVVIDTKFGQP